MKKPYPRACKTVDDIKVGDTLVKDYTISYDTVRKFTEICGDWNPVHHDNAYAETTIFKKQIAHGMISVAQFSGMFGMDTPGLGAVYTWQDVQFMAPAYLDTPYQAIAKVTAVDVATNTVTYETTCIEKATSKEILKGTARLKPVPAKVKAKMDPSTLPR